MVSHSALVLLVDYEPDIRNLEELILREAFYRVVVASPNADPVREAERAYPDVIVFGIRPYEPTDWTSVDRLRSHPSLRAVPVVVISTAEEVVAQAHAAPNVRATLVAPYDVGALQEAVARALDNPPSAAFLPPPTHPVRGEVVVAADALLQGARIIVLRTIDRLRQNEPYVSHFSDLSVALIDDLPSIFGAIVEGMQRDLAPDTFVALPAVSQAIIRHIRLREKQGVGPAVSVHEYQALGDEMVSFLRGQTVGDGFGALDIIDVGRLIDRFVAEVEGVVAEQFGGRAKGCGSGPPIPSTS